MSCEKEEIMNSSIVSEFTNEQRVTIKGYSSDTMKPFISKNENYLIKEKSKQEYHLVLMNWMIFHFII